MAADGTTTIQAPSKIALFDDADAGRELIARLDAKFTQAERNDVSERQK